MTIIDIHNHLRCEEAWIPPFIEDDILNQHALRASIWCARRNWFCLWNFDYTRKKILESSDFLDVDFNIAVGNDEHVVMKHIYNNPEKRDKIFNPLYQSIGYSFYSSNVSRYVYWVILYGMKQYLK